MLHHRSLKTRIPSITYVYLRYDDDNQSRYIQSLSLIQNALLTYKVTFFVSLQGEMRRLTSHTDRRSLKLFIFHSEKDTQIRDAE